MHANHIISTRFCYGRGLPIFFTDTVNDFLWHLKDFFSISTKSVIRSIGRLAVIHDF